MLPIKRILCPLDFSEASLDSLTHATEMAVEFGAELFLVHVLPVLPALPSDPNFVFRVPEYEQALHADAERNLRKLAEGPVAKGVQVHTLVGHGDAGHEIVRLAGEQSADLIIIATHGHTGWRHLAFGSVAEKVVRLAQCPVLVRRAAGAAAHAK